jgi:hypothetical protein
MVDTVASPGFQLTNALLLSSKTAFVGPLTERHGATPESPAGSSRGKVIDPKTRLGMVLGRFPSIRECNWRALQELINFEKQFPGDGEADYRNTIKPLREMMEKDTCELLTVHVGRRIREIGDQSDRALQASFDSSLGEPATSWSDDEIDVVAKRFDDAIEALREMIEYGDLLVDPQTPQTNSEGSRQLTAKDIESSRFLFIMYQSMRAFLESSKVVKYIDSLKVDEGVKKNALRVDLAVRTAAAKVALTVVNDEAKASASMDEKNLTLVAYAKGYLDLARECHWLAERFPKRHAQTLQNLGEILSGAGESVLKEVEYRGKDRAPEFNWRAVIDELLDAEPVSRDAPDFDDEDRAEEKSLDADEAGPSHEESEEAGLGESVEDVASAPLALSLEEEKTLAALPQEADRIREEKLGRIKASIDKTIRRLERIERSLEKKKEALEQIKQSFNRGANIRYLAWDLEDAPKKAANLAEQAQRKASIIVDKLKVMEELSAIAGETGQASPIAEYAEKAAEYENLQQHYESEAKALKLATTKAFLGIESVRKSNAAKRLLTELMDLETGPESLHVTACRTLPKCPPAKNRFGILETEESRPLYDHVVEFRVGMEKVPEFVVHFHFRRPDATSQTPDYYMKNVEIHDWNVQAVQKQETVEKIRGRQLEGGKKVLAALGAAWEKTLEMDRRGKEIAQGAPAIAPSASLRKHKGKGKRR